MFQLLEGKSDIGKPIEFMYDIMLWASWNDKHYIISVLMILAFGCYKRLDIL